MATEILRPQDCLVRDPPPSISRRRTYANNNHFNYYHNHSNHHASTSRSSSRKPVTRSDQRKRVSVGGSSQQAVAEAAPPVALKRTSVDDSRIARSSGYAMEKVSILRRGQSLDPPSLSSAMRSDMYAGSAFAVSPSPSALPLPSFPTRKQASPAVAVDDSATRDLRRLLRLE